MAARVTLRDHEKSHSIFGWNTHTIPLNALDLRLPTISPRPTSVRLKLLPPNFVRYHVSCITASSAIASSTIASSIFSISNVRASPSQPGCSISRRVLLWCSNADPGPPQSSIFDTSLKRSLKFKNSVNVAFLLSADSPTSVRPMTTWRAMSSKASA